MKEQKVVLFNGKPALSLGLTSNGRGVHLRLYVGYMTVPVGEVKPYEGEGNAVTLGLAGKDGEGR